MAHNKEGTLSGDGMSTSHQRALERALDGVLKDPVVIELDGPPMAYFEVPLDYWATPNGEIEAQDHPEASRLTMRKVYQNFRVPTLECAEDIGTAVRKRLLELGGGYIWWRRRPVDHLDGHPISVRLATSPELTEAFWDSLRRSVHDQGVK